MSLAMSTGPGPAAPQPREPLLHRLHRAPATMCPPSSGRIGSRLSRNSDTFTAASSCSIVDELRGDRLVGREDLPADAGTPTTLTGPVGVALLAEEHRPDRAGTLCGSAASS